jgi:hypothetical protein
MADLSRMDSDGGQNHVTVAAGTLAETVAVTGGGRLCYVFGLTSGTASLAIWDSNTTTGASTAVQIVATTAAFTPGTQISVQVPFKYGLLPKQITNTPGCCLTYTTTAPYGA